ncbi:MAG TPA: PAS domain-containing protein [Candidatus Thermoplasmatota archaeon]|nr:PAS domain-containing protein [Candidatus Thermoplasmatota archaeon]
MPVTQDRLTRLREFGLSEYAARSYLALLDLGIGEARDVSSISKVPQAKIYHVLEQLHDKGLVVILPEFPKKYAPVPFEEYLTRLYDEHTKAATAIETERDALAEMFRVMGDTDVGDRGFFTVIRGRRNVLARIEEMVATTQRDLVVLGTAGTASRAGHMIAELRRARERDVRVRILAPVDERTIEGLHPLAELSDLRARELDEAEQSAKVAIVVSDSARAFLIHFVPDDNNVYAGTDIGVFTDQEAMVAAILAIVEPHFARATAYARRRDEILHGRAPEFMRVYANTADARAALARTLARGAAEAASIAWRDPPTEAGARWRCIDDLADASVVERWRAQTKGGRVEARHVRTPAVTQKLVVDDEAFFGIGADVVLHTNSPPVVSALRKHFDALWVGALPLEERSHELEIFPGLRPGDVGIGRLFQLLRDAVIVADPRDRIVLWNPAASTIFGRSASQTRDQPLSSIIGGSARAELEERIRVLRAKAQPGEDAEPFETIALRANGAEFPLEITLSTLHTPEGAPYLVAVGRDITARRRAQQAQNQANERVRHAYERMTEAFYALDSEFRFVYRNPATRAMQQSRHDSEIDGKVLWEAFPDIAGTKFESELKRAMREKKPVRFEETYARLGKTFEVNAYPSEDGLSVYYRDVTESKQPATAAAAPSQARSRGT